MEAPVAPAPVEQPQVELQPEDFQEEPMLKLPSRQGKYMGKSIWDNPADFHRFPIIGSWEAIFGTHPFCGPSLNFSSHHSAQDLWPEMELRLQVAQQTGHPTSP